MERLSVLLIICGFISVFAVPTTHSHQVSGLPKEIVAENHTSVRFVEQDSGEADEDPLGRDRRVIQSGDLLTPPELLPITKRLIAQVDTTTPGQGKGIVSSATSSEQLADSLFHRFCYGWLLNVQMAVNNMRKLICACYWAAVAERSYNSIPSVMVNDRVAKLSKFDIAGIDALQALALNGADVQKNLKLVNVDGARCYVDKMAQEGVVENSMCYFDGPEPRKSIYKLLTKLKNSKTEDNDIISAPRPKREAVEMDQIVGITNNLKKKRHLVRLARRAQNRLRRNNKGPNKTEENGQLPVATTLPPVAETKKKAKLKGCTWRYECPDPRDIDSCKLKTSCPNTEKSEDSIQQEQLLQRARRMIGIASVDEEVEKIFENRIVTFQALKRQRREPRPVLPVAPMETLDQYLTNILQRQETANRNKVKDKNLHEDIGSARSGELVEITPSYQSETDSDNDK